MIQPGRGGEGNGPTRQDGSRIATCSPRDAKRVDGSAVRTGRAEAKSSCCCLKSCRRISSDKCLQCHFSLTPHRELLFLKRNFSVYMIRFILQNLQFFLGAESCFVDTRQLVVIQLPVHKISELNIYLMRPNHNVGRGREQNKKKRPNMDNTRRSYSQSFTLLHIRIDIRQRQE